MISNVQNSVGKDSESEGLTGAPTFLSGLKYIFGKNVHCCQITWIRTLVALEQVTGAPPLFSPCGVGLTTMSTKPLCFLLQSRTDVEPRGRRKTQSIPKQPADSIAPRPVQDPVM